MDELLGLLADDVDLVVSARYVRALSSPVGSRYENRIINVHPSLLPSFQVAATSDRRSVVSATTLSPTGRAVRSTVATSQQVRWPALRNGSNSLR